MPNEQVQAAEIANLAKIDAPTNPLGDPYRTPGERGEATTAGSGLPLKALRQQHPLYDGETWSDYKALYSGGSMLKARVEAGRILRKRVYEPSDYWEERKARLHYLNYLGSIIDYFAAYTFTHRPEFMLRAQERPNAWYQDVFLRDADRRQTDFVDFLKTQLTKALIMRCAYTLVDKPQPSFQTGQPVSRADQEQAGDLRAYTVKLDPREIVDWEEDETGNLEWVMRQTESSRRADPSQLRGEITHEWTYYDKWTYRRWRLTTKADKRLADLPQHTIVPLVDEGVHATPGALPIVRLKLPAGLWVGTKIADIAVAHLNKRSALDWSHFTGLFRMPWVKSAHNTTEGDGEDPGGIVWGSGHALQLGPEDSVGFLEPQGGIDVIAADDLRNLKDEMYRIVHQMSLAVTDQSAQNAPAEGKRRDSQQTVVILIALGTIVREYANQVLQAVSLARGEDVEWDIQGLDKFDIDSLTDMIDDATKLQVISIPSKTFKQEYLTRIALRAVDGLAEEMQQQIREEIEEGVEKQMEAGDALRDANATALADKTAAALKAGATEDEEDDDSEDDDEAEEE